MAKCIANYCEIERPLCTGEVMKVPRSGDELPNPAIYRAKINAAKTMREKHRLHFEYCIKMGLYSNMDPEERELFIDLKDKYLAM